MIYRCINNDEALAPDVLYHGYRHPSYVDNTLTIGRSYVVYGMSLYNDDLKYLIRNDSGHARWKAPYFFKEVDSRLPPYWEFRAFDQTGLTGFSRRTFQAIWGYPILVRHPEHNSGLIDIVPYDMEVFAEEIERRAAYDL